MNDQNNESIDNLGYNADNLSIKIDSEKTREEKLINDFFQEEELKKKLLIVYEEIVKSIYHIDENYKDETSKKDILEKLNIELKEAEEDVTSSYKRLDDLFAEMSEESKQIILDKKEKETE